MKCVAILALCVASTLASLSLLQSNPLNRAWDVLPRSSELASTEISFLVHLRQCNVDELEQDFWAISDPDNERYRHFKTLEEINSLVVCDELDQMIVMKHFSLYAIKVIPVGKTALRVICTVEQAEEMLNTDFAEFKHSKSQKVLIRQTGGVYIPSDLAGRVEYISSISDFFHGGKYIPITGAREKFLNRNQVSQQTNGTQILSDLMVQPKLIHRKYKIPEKHLNNSKSSIGIGAFGNSYSEEDLCRFQDLFNDYEAGSTVTVLDVPLAQIAEGVESDLDVQYSTAISRGINEQFADYGNGAWIIDWATGTTQDSNRALVWSLSYGFPEVWQCDITNDTECNSGYVKYITLCNQEFMKLANLGVTVMVAAGDDGTPGYATNCPLDPNTPMAGAYTAEGEEMSCQTLLGTNEECQCAGVLIELTTAQGTEVCPYPVGFLYAGLGQVNYTCDFLDSQASNYNAEAFLLFNETYAEFLTQDPAGCVSTEASMAAPELGLPLNPFYSTCACSQYQPKSKTVSGQTISIKPYTYSPDNGPAFLPDFPTSSPYVTSVGATAMSYSTDPNNCRIDPSVPEIYCSTLDPSGYSGGGGFSSFQNTFSAQTTVVQKYLSTAQNLPPSQAFNANGRAYPDVAALGHNFVIISVEAVLFFELPEQLELVGGTSAASPTFAGMVARLNDQLLSNNKSPLGYLNPLLYKMAAAEPGTFTDIVPQVINTFGVNVTAGASSRCTQEYCCEFGFEVATGWDPATGLGTPNYDKISKYISDNL